MAGKRPTLQDSDMMRGNEKLVCRVGLASLLTLKSFEAMVGFRLPPKMRRFT